MKKSLIYTFIISVSLHVTAANAYFFPINILLFGDMDRAVLENAKDKSTAEQKKARENFKKINGSCKEVEANRVISSLNMFSGYIFNCETAMKIASSANYFHELVGRDYPITKMIKTGRAATKRSINNYKISNYDNFVAAVVLEQLNLTAPRRSKYFDSVWGPELSEEKVVEFSDLIYEKITSEISLGEQDVTCLLPGHIDCRL